MLLARSEQHAKSMKACALRGYTKALKLASMSHVFANYGVLDKFRVACMDEWMSTAWCVHTYPRKAREDV
jgi:hypothetical protein